MVNYDLYNQKQQTNRPMSRRRRAIFIFICIGTALYTIHKVQQRADRDSSITIPIENKMDIIS